MAYLGAARRTQGQTQEIYGLIKDEKWKEAIGFLSAELQVRALDPAPAREQ